jgi:hypothetical protein
MAGQEIQINGAEAVVWTHQIELPVQGQIAEDNGSKLSEGNETSNRLVVFRLGGIRRLEACAVGIWPASARQRRL